MDRRLTSTLVATCLLSVVAASPLAAQSLESDVIGLGGRVEVPEAGYAVTLPDDWVYVRPTAADTTAILEAVTAIAPDLATFVEAGLARGASVSLVAIAPIRADAAFTMNCNVVDSPSGGLSLDLRVAGEVAAYRALGDVLTAGPDVSTLDLPAGPAARLDAGLSVPGYEASSSSYLYPDGAAFHTLTCTDLGWPADHWLSIAETFEFIPTKP